ncbi:MAG: hypothetical protein ABII71_02750 [Candidatus Micrarchaeota archaeon]
MAEKKSNVQVPNILKSAAATMAADVLLLVGFVFLLLGMAKFLNDFIEIPGIGEAGIGAALLVIGIIILLNSKMRIRIAKVPMMPQGMMPQMPPQPPVPDAPSDSYR